MVAPGQMIILLPGGPGSVITTMNHGIIHISLISILTDPGRPGHQTWAADIWWTSRGLWIYEILDCSTYFKARNVRDTDTDVIWQKYKSQRIPCLRPLSMFPLKSIKEITTQLQTNLVEKINQKISKKGWKLLTVEISHQILDINLLADGNFSDNFQI